MYACIDVVSQLWVSWQAWLCTSVSRPRDLSIQTVLSVPMHLCSQAGSLSSSTSVGISGCAHVSECQHICLGPGGRGTSWESVFIRFCLCSVPRVSMGFLMCQLISLGSCTFTSGSLPEQSVGGSLHLPVCMLVSHCPHRSILGACIQVAGTCGPVHLSLCV